MDKRFKVAFVAMSGVRVYNERLFNTGLTLPGFVDRSKVIASLPSLGLITLAAYTPDHWESTYQDIDQVDENSLVPILEQAPDIVAFSSTTARINDTYKLADELRSKGITVVLGGLHVTALPEEAMQHADAVVQGEGEIIWSDLIRDFEDGKLRPLYSSFGNERYEFHMEEAKIPRYDLLDPNKYNRITIQTTRGCPWHCNFCASSRTISSHYKKKPIEQIRKELDRIFEIWDRPFIELADDNTFVDKDWSKELLKLFAEYDMAWFTETDISVAYDEELLQLLAESNCLQVLIGFETINPENLKNLDEVHWKYKQFENYNSAIDKIQSYGISVNGCFVIGFDNDTKETLQRTQEYLETSTLSEVQITLLTPFPGTGLYNELKAENRLITDNYWDKCTLFDLNFKPKNFTVEELEDEFLHLMKTVYSDENVKRRKKIFKQTLHKRPRANEKHQEIVAKNS